MLIFAHRGASAYAPENTMAAFELAYEMGSKAIELDVQMTADGHFVVIHDYTLDRTTNGSGLVMESFLEYVQNLDAGSWFDQRFKGVQVPSLKEVLTWLPEDLVLNIEVKRFMLDTRDFAEPLIQLVKTSGKLQQVMFSSFNHEFLMALAKYDVKIGVLTSSKMINPKAYLVNHGLNLYSYNPSAEFVDEQLVESIHQENLKVYVYTVNDLRLANYLVEIGVDGIFSNEPDLMTKG